MWAISLEMNLNRILPNISVCITRIYQHPRYLYTISDDYPHKILVQQLDLSIQFSNLSSTMSVHAQLLKLHPPVSISLWNKILNMYCQSDYFRYSHQLFEDMPQRDVISFNTMISACLRHNHHGVEPLRFFMRMLEENVKPNQITLSALLVASSGLVAHKQIHARAIKSGLNFDKFVGSSLVDGYSKCLRLEYAMRSFYDIGKLDLISWNIALDACVINGSEEDALRIFSRMQGEGIEFDSFTLTSIIKMCTEPKHLDWGVQIHTCVIRAGLDFKTPVGNALVTMYSKCEKGMESASRVFWKIPKPNIISWTAMISGFKQNGLCKEAVGFYQEMVREGVMENEFSFASILPACGSLASLEQGRQVHSRIVKSECGCDKLVGNALVDMYADCGSLEDAQLAFTTMEKRDVVSWTTMIAGFGRHGKGAEALEILDHMRREDVKPDGVTFLGVLTACSHSGLVEEGLGIFQLMIDYGFRPNKEHYTCVVDMLGRSGRLKEAERFIVDRGIESDASVWEALLGACRIHGEKELGEKSAEKIMKLEPQKDGPYVLLSNIYAEKGMWEDKRKVRGRLDASGLRKEVGCSWVGIGNTV